MYNIIMKRAVLILIILLGLQNVVFAAEGNQVKDDGVLLYSMNKINEAKEVFEQIPQDSRDAETWLLLSNIAQDLQDEGHVEVYLRYAINKDPKYYKAYYNLGILSFNKGDIDEAIDYFKTALKYNKKNSYILTNLGCCYLAKKNLTIAKFYFNKAINLNSQNPTNYYNLAYIYKQKNNVKKAQELLDIYNKLMQEKAY